MELVFLIGTAVNICSALYLYRQAATLRKANALVRGIYEKLTQHPHCATCKCGEDDIAGKRL